MRVWRFGARQEVGGLPRRALRRPTHARVHMRGHAWSCAVVEERGGEASSLGNSVGGVREGGPGRRTSPCCHSWRACWCCSGFAVLDQSEGRRRPHRVLFGFPRSPEEVLAILIPTLPIPFQLRELCVLVCWWGLRLTKDKTRHVPEARPLQDCVQGARALCPGTSMSWCNGGASMARGTSCRPSRWHTFDRRSSSPFPGEWMDACAGPHRRSCVPSSR